MELDYQALGLRIRKFRQQKGLTQARASELVGIEPSYLSHIERGATKLSLPTLVSIANLLDVSADELLYGNLKQERHVSIEELEQLLSDCSDREVRAIIEFAKTAKTVLRQL